MTDKSFINLTEYSLCLKATNCSDIACNSIRSDNVKLNPISI